MYTCFPDEVLIYSTAWSSSGVATTTESCHARFFSPLSQTLALSCTDISHQKPFSDFKGIIPPFPCWHFIWNTCAERVDFKDCNLTVIKWKQSRSSWNKWMKTVFVSLSSTSVFVKKKRSEQLNSMVCLCYCMDGISGVEIYFVLGLSCEPLQYSTVIHVCQHVQFLLLSIFSGLKKKRVCQTSQAN